MIKELLPPSIVVDDGIQKLAESTEGVFSFLFSEAGKTLIYSRIDELPEEVLDLLAWQFHTEGYELAKTIEEKRSLIKKAIELHRYKGTKYAVGKALEALGVDGVLEEWFEYGGEPYHFRVFLSGIREEARWNEVVKAIDEYKNVRSWYDILAYNKATQGLSVAFSVPHGYRYRLFPHIEVGVLQTQHSCGAQLYYAYQYNIPVYSPSVSTGNSALYVGSVMCTATKMEVVAHG